jgi:hypothetical protein
VSITHTYLRSEGVLAIEQSSQRGHAAHGGFKFLIDRSVATWATMYVGDRSVVRKEDVRIAAQVGDLNKINPNLKRFQIINHRRKYFIRITLFCHAVRGGAAEELATPLPVARQWLPRRHGGPLQ